MVFNIYQPGLEEAVRGVVAANSNHATDFYERLIWADASDMVHPDSLPPSDNFCGRSKTAYQLLGFVFAAGKMGALFRGGAAAHRRAVPQRRPIRNPAC